MNNIRKKIFFIVLALVLLVSFTIYLVKDYYIPKYNWEETYDYKSAQPYGTKLLFDILSSSHNKEDFVVISKSPDVYLRQNDTSSLYVFAGLNFYADSISSEALMNFVSRGNHVFISSVNETHSLFDKLTNSEYPVLYHSSIADTIITVAFGGFHKDSVFKFNHRYQKKLTGYNWVGFDYSVITDSLSYFGFEKVSQITTGLVNCFRVQHGKGWFIFHFTPILFTNYNLSKDEGLRYANTLLSQYSKSKVYWDEYSKNTPTEGYQQPAQSPLRFVLSNPGLRWSWYLICFFILLFVVFNLKRKQAAIPLMPANRNTTLEYISAIAMLHYQNKSLDFLADEIMKQFLSFVKHKYGISPHLDKKEMARQLAPVSGVEEEKLQTMVKRYLDVKYLPEVNYLIEFYQLTEYFYKKCK